MTTLPWVFSRHSMKFTILIQYFCTHRCSDKSDFFPIIVWHSDSLACLQNCLHSLNSQGHPVRYSRNARESNDTTLLSKQNKMGISLGLHYLQTIHLSFQTVKSTFFLLLYLIPLGQATGLLKAIYTLSFVSNHLMCWLLPHLQDCLWFNFKITASISSGLIRNVFISIEFPIISPICMYQVCIRGSVLICATAVKRMNYHWNLNPGSLNLAKPASIQVSAYISCF